MSRTWSTRRVHLSDSAAPAALRVCRSSCPLEPFRLPLPQLALPALQMNAQEPPQGCCTSQTKIQTSFGRQAGVRAALDARTESGAAAPLSSAAWIELSSFQPPPNLQSFFDSLAPQ